MADARLERGVTSDARPDDPEPVRPFVVAVVVLVLLTVLVRLAIVEMWPPDLDVTIQRDGRPTSEEILRGVAAHDVLTGPLIPFDEHRTNDFTGGSLVASIAAVPFFAVLGSSLFTLRVSTLLFTCTAVLAAFLLLDRTVGRRAAWMGGLFLALPPPALAIQSCMSYGTHAESVAVVLVAVYLWTAAARRGDLEREFAAGCALGFALFFTTASLLVLLVLLLLDLVRDPRWILSRRMLARAAGFLLGFAPEIAHRAASEGSALSPYGRSVAEHVDLAAVPERLVRLVTRDVELSYLLPHGLGWVAAAAVAAAIARVAWTRFSALRSDRARAARDPGLVAVLFTIAFALAYAATGFGVEHDGRSSIFVRYFSLVHAFTLLGVAIAAAEAPRAFRPLCTLAVAALVALFGFGVATRLVPANRGRAHSIPGHNDSLFARVVMRRYGGALESHERYLARVVSRRPPAVVDDMLFSGAVTLRWMLAPDRALTPRNRAEVAGLEAARAWYHAHAPAAQRAYFAPIVPGEPDWNPGDQDRFRAWHAAR